MCNHIYPQLICRTFGGNLAEVRTQAELNLITQRVTQGRREFTFQRYLIISNGRCTIKPKIMYIYVNKY